MPKVSIQVSDEEIPELGFLKRKTSARRRSVVDRACEEPHPFIVRPNECGDVGCSSRNKTAEGKRLKQHKLKGSLTTEAL